jgi:hypothetical protein
MGRGLAYGRAGLFALGCAGVEVTEAKPLPIDGEV